MPGGETRYIRTEEVILEHVSQIFKDDTILEKTVFCVTRNADINPDDEAFDFDSDDFRGKMKNCCASASASRPCVSSCPGRSARPS